MSNKLVIAGAVIFLLILLFVGFVAGVIVGHVYDIPSIGTVPSTSATYDLDLVDEAMAQIQNSYVKKVPGRKLIQGAIKGMMESLNDPYTRYYTKSDFRFLQEESRGHFFGVGIELGLTDHNITVVSPIEGTPAFKAGIKAGDIITKIDGKETKNMSLNEAVERIRGEEGTTVVLTMSRADVKKPLAFKLVRAKISLPNVVSRMLEPGIGYVRLHAFTEDSGSQFSEELDKMKREGAKGIVLDLRNNPGGVLEESVNIASNFIESGPIVSVKGRTEGSQTYVARGNAYDFKLVILVNKGSASASEIVAGAVQDTKRGVLIGENTFGKGSVQSVIDLSDGSGLTMTVAEYFTPKGRSIHKKGVKPDIVVSLEKNAQKDNQLEKAKEVLKLLIQGKDWKEAA
jgi:carboxyl-terminal processing protease